MVINRDISPEMLKLLYNAYNINRENCDLYLDIILSLFILIDDTYLGDDLMSLNNKKEHFDWCWNKIICDFKSENVIIRERGLYLYLINLAFEYYYLVDKNQLNFDMLLSKFNDLFSYTTRKTDLNIEIFIDTYELLTNSIFFSS